MNSKIFCPKFFQFKTFSIIDLIGKFSTINIPCTEPKCLRIFLKSQKLKYFLEYSLKSRNNTPLTEVMTSLRVRLDPEHPMYTTSIQLPWASPILNMPGLHGALLTASLMGLHVFSRVGPLESLPSLKRSSPNSMSFDPTCQHGAS